MEDNIIIRNKGILYRELFRGMQARHDNAEDKKKKSNIGANQINGHGDNKQNVMKD